MSPNRRERERKEANETQEEAIKRRMTSWVCFNIKQQQQQQKVGEYYDFEFSSSSHRHHLSSTRNQIKGMY